MKKYKVLVIILLSIVIISLLVTYFSSVNIPVLEPKGVIAQKELNLIEFALGLSLVVVIPVFFLLFLFAYKYREGNLKKTHYSPNLSGNRIAEIIWWTIPSLIIVVLSVVTWQSSHSLDPYRPIASTHPALNVEVVALDWRWLFIYPKYNVASINYLDIPNNVPINLHLTSDAPMNSFWVPALAGQIYAMPGMSTQLHLMATSQGSYQGSSANISGNGFSKMIFTVRSNSTSDFNSWINKLKNSTNSLSLADYTNLAEPSENSAVQFFSKVNPNLYNDIIMKYMAPVMNNTQSNSSGSMNSMGGGMQ